MATLDDSESAAPRDSDHDDAMQTEPATAGKGSGYPTPFQRKTLWASLTAVGIVVLGGIGVGAIVLTSYVLGFLQPVLIPVAVAAIIAYLLEPVVRWLDRKDNRLDHRRSVLVVFIGFVTAAILLAVLVLRPAIGEAIEFWNEQVSTGDLKARFAEFVDDKTVTLEERFSGLPFYAKAEEWIKGGQAVDWLSEKLTQFSQEIGRFLGRGFSSAASVLGYLFGMLLVPLYLYFFLRESSAIAHNWSRYLPLQDSSFKDEVVEVLKEINDYLIAFFRGQMVVSMIDGVLVAIGLMIIGLPYAMLIGVFVAILGLIPYLGNLLCLIPAVLIAIAHFGNKEEVKVDPANPPAIGSEIEVVVAGETEMGFVSQLDEDGTIAEVLTNTWSILPTQVWVYPLIVIGLFFVLQQINGLVTAPKIVGDSVGLHPVTVIFSMLFWSLLLGGLLGALLAVPLTASVKVLFRRYIWERRRKKNLGADGDDEGSEEADGAVEDESDEAGGMVADGA